MERHFSINGRLLLNNIQNIKFWFVKAIGICLLLALLVPVSVMADKDQLVGDWKYKINEGDTLWDVAEKYLSGNELTESLRRYNNVLKPRQLPTGTVINIPLAWIERGETYATVTDVKGVSYRIAGGTIKKNLIKVGDHLIAGETLVSEENSAVTIRLMDGSSVYLRSLSRLVLRKLQHFKGTDMVDTRLELPFGRVESTITPQRGPGSRFEIHSPSVITSVRGTQYRLEADALTNTSRVMVTEGVVRLAQPQAKQFVDLAAGFGALAQKNVGITKPEALLAAPELIDFPTDIDAFPATLEFLAVNNAEKYQLEIGVKGSTLPITEIEINGHQYQLNKAGMAPGRYWVKIRAVKDNGLSGLDQYREFNVSKSATPSSSTQSTVAMQSVPSAKRLSTNKVIPGINVASGTQPSGYINLFWKTDQKMEEFRLQLSENAKFDELLIDLAGIKTFRYTVERALGPGKYFWRVSAKQSNQEWGPFSEVGIFNVSP